MNTRTFQQLISFVCAVISASAIGYEIPNHADMSENALLKSALFLSPGKLSRLGLKQIDPRLNTQRLPLPNSLPPIPMCFGVVRGSNGAMVANTAPGVQPPWRQDARGSTNLSIANLIRYGACYEDNEGPLLGIDQRPVAHFYDPQQSGRGIVGDPSSPDWMLAGMSTTLSGVNHFGWVDARVAFYKALTSVQPAVVAPDIQAANDKYVRDEAWATTFQSLGHLVHHLQDMAQPQHTRSDDHCDALPCRLGIYKPSGYEKHLLNNRLEFVQQLAATASAPIMFGLPREFWNAVVPVNQPLSGAPNLQEHIASTLGIAAYTATNFVSAGSDFVGGTTDGITVWGQRADHPYPRAANELRPVSLAQLFADAAPSTLVGVTRDLCEGDATTCYMQFVGTEADPQARTSALSNFGQALLRPPGAFSPPNISGGLGIFQQNFFTYDDAARKLVPRAVEYSAGLINYFFRGEMEISLPDEGVYGIVDHSVEKDKGVHGFRFIKMKVKNTTPDINSARGTIAQNMTNGQFFAVAKFHRNTCYTPTLTGQIGTIGRGANPSVNFWSSCRGPVEEIVVSEPEPGVSDLPANGAAVPMAFDFLTPIPIEATDLSIQVVFKGTLGEEPSAVAVTTKSISEPSFLTNLDASDMIACGTNEPTICRRVDDVNAPVFFRDEAASLLAAQSLPPSQSSKFGFNRWLGFNPAQPRSKVVEWHVARTDLPNPPQFKVDRGTFRRIAVLADIDIPTRVVNWGSSSETVVTNVDQDDVPVTLGLFNTGNFYGPTTESLIPAVERFATTRIKESADGSAPTDLPKYAVIRGVVVGVRKTRSSAPDWLPTLLYSNGENVAAASYGDAVKHPPNTTVHERGPALPETAIRSVGDIKFSRGPAYSLPEYTEFDLSMMRDDADGERARKYQPRFVRGLEYPGGYYWTFQ